MDDDDVLLLSAAICRSLIYLRRKKRRRRFWIHPVNANRHAQGAYRDLIEELRSDLLLFRRYYRMSVEQFDILSQVEDRIQLCNIKYRNTIAQAEQLAICSY